MWFAGAAAGLVRLLHRSKMVGEVEQKGLGPNMQGQIQVSSQKMLKDCACK
jgi:hypothetical protein